MADRTTALGEIAWDVLRRIVRELVARKPGGHLVEGGLDEIELGLRLPLHGNGSGPEVFSDDLVAAIDAQIDDALQRATTFRPGHSFCHRCGTAPCEHSRPPTARHVFLSYAPTGTPQWVDFAQLCLERRHPEVDRLYETPPAFVTLLREPRELKGDLLPAFRHDARFDLLGQVDAGFFPVRTRDGEGRGVVALSFQVASWRPRRGKLRLGLNVLGRNPSGDSLDLLWERHDEIPWRRAVRWAQAALDSVARARRGRLERVDGILNGLARRLERERRAAGRRTRHAEERHRSGERPTRKAIDDLRSVGHDAIFVDEKHGTLVVAGERGRTHFFTEEGRHVSSVRYSREAVARKIERGVWRGARDDEAKALLARIVDEGARS